MAVAAWGGREPRRWQSEALREVRSALLSGIRAPIVHACTGAGKSALLAELAATTRGRVLLTTPTQALVDQLSATVNDRCPGEVGRCYQHAWEADARIVVICHASLPTLAARQSEWAVWLADEAHKLEGDALRTARESIRRRLAIGLTATPFRADGRGLAWDRQIYSYPAARAVEDGVLVPWRTIRIGSDGHEPILRDDGRGPDVDACVARWVRECAEGPGVVSALSIPDAEAYAARLTAEGVPSAAVHSRMGRQAIRDAVERLRSGEIRCVVHVALLVEGVDLPWLRWLALRRPVRSATRLVQEVGRVLRAAPGKSHADLYDPHDLIGAVGLVHPSQIDALAADDEPDEAPAEDALEIPELEGLGELATMPPGVVVPRLEGWLVDLRGSLLGAGIVQPTLIPEGRWRQRRASDRQREAVAKALRWRGRLPAQEHRDAMKWLADRPEMGAGVASDMLDVLYGLSRQCSIHGFRWMLPARLVPSP